MGNVSSSLQAAVNLHQSGDLVGAEEIYRGIIHEDPTNADALHLLGVAAQQRGDMPRAIECIEQAVAANDRIPLFHSNLGAVYRSSGQLDRAIESFQQSLMLQPDFGEGRYNLALAFEAQGRIDDAILGFQKTIELLPDFAPAYVNCGRLLSAAGKHVDAIECFRDGRVIAANSADLAYNLGNSLQSLGRTEEAIAALRDAAKLQPDSAAIQNNLGSALKTLDQLDEAEVCFRRALELDPEHTDARSNIATLRPSAAGRQESIEELRDALARQPDSVNLRCALAASLQGQDRGEEALPLWEAAAIAAPERADVQFSLASAYTSQALPRKAIQAYERGLELDPVNRDTLRALGALFVARDNLDEAAACFEQALQIDPNDALAAYDLGNVFKDQSKTEAALQQFDLAIRSRPDLTVAHISRGLFLKSLGRIEEAIASQTAALHLGDRNAEARYHRALAELTNGDFENGWSDYESRWQCDANPRQSSLPVWNGEALHDRSLLVFAEQGIGEEIMFASCLPDIVNRTQRCVIECDARLVPLFARSFPLAEVIPRNNNADHTATMSSSGCDLQIAFGSLPSVCRTRIEDFPHARRFLAPDSDVARRWKSRLDAIGTGLKVGVSWRGGADPVTRERRSTTLRQWKPVFDVAGIHFINLQYGECLQELQAAKRDPGIEIHDWDDGNPLRNPDGFAAQISALDLVISIDNSTVHMAGALGVPVWTILPDDPDWRWMRDRDDSPWYRTMRLFRQTNTRQWDTVFDAVADQLSSLAGMQTKTVVHDSQPIAVEDTKSNSETNADADAAVEKERRKYETIWTHDVYRKKSPGLDDADKVQLIEHLRQRNVKTILDAGCGSGKLMQRLMTQHADEFSVHGFDISRNCLDPFFDDIKDDVLTVGCLWNPADMPGKYDAVLCTDVLEHIPTDRIPAVLSNLRSCTRNFAYLAIALFPDGFGPQLIGEPLHLTVQPPNWWFAKISVEGFQIESQAVETHPSGQDMWLHVLATV